VENRDGQGPLRGVYGIAVGEEDVTICFVGRSQQLERRAVVLRHPPWPYADDRYTVVPLAVEPFPRPDPAKLVEQAAIKFYGEQAGQTP
jgi:hypothetical protein